MYALLYPSISIFLFFRLRIDDGDDDVNNAIILSHITSGMVYEKSTPVTSDIRSNSTIYNGQRIRWQK